MTSLPFKIVALLIVCALPVDAADPKIEFFESKIRPVLVEHCYSCHSADAKNVRGGLLLDSQPATLDGGESGAAVVPGKPEESLLIDALKHESFEMPPDRKLPASVIADFEQWIRDGAADPRQDGETIERSAINLDEGRQFWSFQPVVAYDPPAVADDDWSISDIDRFIVAKLRADSIPVAADASPEQIYRRLSFGLIGRPPEPNRIRNFTAAYQRNPDAAVGSAVEEFLASPLFGQRWGRHWLDVVRFAESSGGGRSLIFPHAWRFRDYVIRSFNNDKPFDQLIREHIAGDLLTAEDDARRNDQLIGVGYLALGPTNYELQDKALLRMEIVDEQVDTFGRTFLGMTIGCARCHDHKFDPIPTADYYALSGIFRSTKSLLPGNVGSPVTNPLRTAQQHEELKTWEKRQAELTAEIATLKQVLKPGRRFSGTIHARDVDGICIDDTQASFEGVWTKSSHTKPWVNDGYQHNGNQKNGQRVRFDVPVPETGRYRVDLSYSASSNRCSDVLVRISDGKPVAEAHVDQRQRPSVDGLFHEIGEYDFSAGANVAVSIDAKECGPGVVIIDAVRLVRVTDSPQRKPSEEAIAKIRATKEQLAGLEKELKQHQNQKPKNAVAMGVMDEAKPSDWHIHIRGGIRNLGPVVPRGALSVLNHAGDDLQSPFEIADTQSGRLQLANWIASPNNPLTARVFVNRVWLHLIGEGIVRTPDNLGKTGRLPSHPELLDYLATSFVHEDDWSVKNLIRRIVTSHVYRLSSSGPTDADPRNQYFGRAFRRRLEAEPLRDTVLTVSGHLDTSVDGGLTIGKISQYDNGYDHDRYHPNLPSVFVPALRNAPLKFFEVFDFANQNLVVGQRTVSTLPAQALYLLNSPFLLKHSAAAAERFLDRPDIANAETEERLKQAWLMTLGRQPSIAERNAMKDVLSPPHHNDAQAWAAVFQALFASVDFRYID